MKWRWKMGAVMAENFSDMLAESARLARASLAVLERAKAAFYGGVTFAPMPEDRRENLVPCSLSESDFLAVESIAKDADSIAELTRLLSAEFALTHGQDIGIGHAVFTRLDGLDGVNVYAGIAATISLHGVLQMEGLTDATEGGFCFACFGLGEPVKWLGNTLMLSALSDALRRVGLLADRRNDERMTAIFCDASGAKIPAQRLSKKRDRGGYSECYKRAYAMAEKAAKSLEIYRIL